jgi:hypothetical protein
MRASGRVLVTKTFHVIAQLAEGGRRGTARQSTAHDNDLELAAIIWTNQSRMIAMAAPFIREWAGWNLGVELADHVWKNDEARMSNDEGSTKLE